MDPHSAYKDDNIGRLRLSVAESEAQVIYRGASKNDLITVPDKSALVQNPQNHQSMTTTVAAINKSHEHISFKDSRSVSKRGS